MNEIQADEAGGEVVKDKMNVGLMFVDQKRI
jgi:hypothetical protein